VRLTATPQGGSATNEGARILHNRGVAFNHVALEFTIVYNGSRRTAAALQ
jgi:hypothetical protein